MSSSGIEITKLSGICTIYPVQLYQNCKNLGPTWDFIGSDPSTCPPLQAQALCYNNQAEYLMNQQISAVQSSIDQLKSTLDADLNNVTNANAQALKDLANQQLTQLNALKSANNAALSALNDAKTKLQQDLTTAQAQYAAAADKMEQDYNAKEQQYQTQMDKAMAALKQAQADYDTQAAALVAEFKEQQQTIIDSANKKVQDLAQQQSDIQASISAYQTETSQLVNTAKTAAQGQLADLQKQRDTLSAQITQQQQQATAQLQTLNDQFAQTIGAVQQKIDAQVAALNAYKAQLQQQYDAYKVAQDADYAKVKAAFDAQIQAFQDKIDQREKEITDTQKKFSDQLETIKANLQQLYDSFEADQMKQQATIIQGVQNGVSSYQQGMDSEVASLIQDTQDFIAQTRASNDQALITSNEAYDKMITDQNTILADIGPQIQSKLDDVKTAASNLVKTKTDGIAAQSAKQQQLNTQMQQYNAQMQQQLQAIADDMNRVIAGYDDEMTKLRTELDAQIEVIRNNMNDAAAKTKTLTEAYITQQSAFVKQLVDLEASYKAQKDDLQSQRDKIVDIYKQQLTAAYKKYTDRANIDFSAAITAATGLLDEKKAQRGLIVAGVATVAASVVAYFGRR